MNFQKKSYFSYPCPRKLREIVKMSLMERETKDTIKTIWEEYHSNKPRTVAYIIEANEMNILRKKYYSHYFSGKANPVFLFPVKKDQGYYNMISQSQDKSFVIHYLHRSIHSSNTTKQILVMLLLS